MMLLALALAPVLLITAQDAQFVKQTFFADKNIVFSGMTRGADGGILVCTSKESFPDDFSGVAIRRLAINGDVKDKTDLRLDMVHNFALTPDGGFIVLFNYDMFSDAKGVRLDFSNSSEYYMAERDYENMPGVVKVSKYGSLEWVLELKPAQYFSDGDESALFVLPDNRCWIVFNYSAEDTTSEFGAQDDFTRALMIAANGTVLFEKDFIDNDHGVLRAPVLLEDGRLLLFSDTRHAGGGQALMTLDTQGNLVQMAAIPGLEGVFPNDIVAAGNFGFAFTHHENQVNYVTLIDRAGKTAWKLPATGNIHAMTADESALYAVSTEKSLYGVAEGTPVRYTITRYDYSGAVTPVMTLTADGPVDPKKLIRTEYSFVMAGNIKQPGAQGVAVLVTVPETNADIFRNMNAYDYREYAKAVENNDLERIRALAAFGIDPDFKAGSAGDRETEADNPLLVAFKLGKYDLAEELLKSGADPDAVDKVPVRYFIYERAEIYNLPVTPLMYIALTPGFYDAPKYVELLNKYNADFKRITRDGTAFRQAFQMQNTEFMDLYSQYVTFSTDDLNNLFAPAYEFNLPQSLKWILDRGANANSTDFMGDSYLEKGMQSDSKEIKAVLKEWQKTHKH